MPIFFTREAQKQYVKLNPLNRKKIGKKIKVLEKEPLTGKKLSGNLFGQYSLKAWPYRIIYYLDLDKHEVWITGILHRQSAYK